MADTQDLPMAVMSVDFRDNAPVGSAVTAKSLTEAKIAAILADIAAGEPAYKAIESNGATRKAFYAMLATDTETGNRYARVKAVGMERWADEIVEIADQCRMGEKRKLTNIRVGNDGDVPREEDGKFSPNARYIPVEEITTGDMVERSKLMIDARKWLLSKLAPKKYGDKIQNELSGEVTFATISYKDKPEQA